MEHSNASHEYKANTTQRSGPDTWDCFRDGVWKAGYTVTYMGFSWGLLASSGRN